MAVVGGVPFERIPRDCIHAAIWRAAMSGQKSVSWNEPISAATLRVLERGGWTVSVRGSATIVLLKH